MLGKLKLKLIDFFGTLMMWCMMYLDDFWAMIRSVAITLVCVKLMTVLFFMPCVVDGSSMYPTLEDQQLGFSSIIANRLGKIERFDIVTIQKYDSEDKLVKRVIGLPNETVMCVNGQIYINGEPISEPFLDPDYVKSQCELHMQEYFTEDFSFTLGDDEYFCLGDNRLTSLDSRFYGPFKREQIRSVGFLRFYPFDGAGIVK